MHIPSNIQMSFTQYVTNYEEITNPGPVLGLNQVTNGSLILGSNLFSTKVLSSSKFAVVVNKSVLFSASEQPNIILDMQQ